jgi:hypothetical protein
MRVLATPLVDGSARNRWRFVCFLDQLLERWQVDVLELLANARWSSARWVCSDPSVEGLQPMPAIDIYVR